MSEDKPVILLVIPNLNFGGAQRVFHSMSLDLSRKYRVVECVFNFDFGHAFQTGNEVVSLNVRGGTNLLSKFRSFLIRVKRLKQLKEKLNPILCISHLEGADLINILSGHREKTITWVHGSKKYDQNIEGFLGFIRHHLLIPFTYKRAGRVVTVSEAIREELISYYGIKAEKIVTVYNSFDIERIRFKAQLPIDALYQEIFKSGITLVFSGRLARQKNPENFLRWFAQFRQVCPCKLVMVGDGEFRERLLLLCSDLRLKVFSVWNNDTPDAHQDIYFLGFQDNPFNFISNSTAFILPSLWEGFPMAIGEAMACGTPIIAADCPTGPKEMLHKQGEVTEKLPYLAGYGMLLPVLNTDCFHIWNIQVSELLTNKEKLKEYSIKSLERAYDFSLTKNSQRVAALVNSVLQN